MIQYWNCKLHNVYVIVQSSYYVKLLGASNKLSRTVKYTRLYVHPFPEINYVTIKGFFMLVSTLTSSIHIKAKALVFLDSIQITLHIISLISHVFVDSIIIVCLL